MANEGCKLSVRGLPPNISIEQIEQAFSRFGRMTNASNTGHGEALLTMSSHTDAENLINMLNGTQMFGQTIQLEVFQQKDVDLGDLLKKFSRFSNTTESPGR